MLIPSIDLQGGKLVQLVQGERLAIETDDVFGWAHRFRRFPRVQLIDLDRAKGTGRNDSLIRQLCALLPCRVGGGLRSIASAQDALTAGATQVIVGSRLFQQNRPDAEFAADLAAAVGAERIIAAVDSRDGQIVVHGWQRSIPVSPVDAMRVFEPYCGEFLYTHVDTEGLMTGIDFDAVRRIRDATDRRVAVAGGIATMDEINRLDQLGVDAIVGMAIYTGAIPLE